MIKKIIVCLSLVSCSEGQPSNYYRVYIDPAFGDQIQPIESAIYEWNTQVRKHGGVLNLQPYVMYKEFSDNCSQEIIIHATNSFVIAAMDKSVSSAEYITLGLTSNNKQSDCAEVHIITDMPNNIDTKWIAAHELGHAMWMVHTEPGTLMTMQYPDQPHAITCKDLQQWSKLQGQNMICSD
jgi:hypothetical protein